jgi:hypothetical protein
MAALGQSRTKKVFANNVSSNPYKPTKTRRALASASCQ